MIRLTRINHVPLVLNSDLIEHVEATPDTVVALTTGQKLVVLESAEEVIQKVIDFRRSIAGHPALAAATDGNTAQAEAGGLHAQSQLWPVKPAH
jgi:flagellar protein FlbD